MRPGLALSMNLTVPVARMDAPLFAKTSYRLYGEHAIMSYFLRKLERWTKGGITE